MKKLKYKPTEQDQQVIVTQPPDRQYLKLKTIKKLRDYNNGLIASLEKLLKKYNSEALSGALESAKNTEDFLSYLIKYYQSGKRIYVKL